MVIPLASQIWKTLKLISNQRVSIKYRFEPESIKSNDSDILNWRSIYSSTKCNSLISKCFIQFACTNLDGCQKEGVFFKICFRKRGYPEKEDGGIQPWRKLVWCNILSWVFLFTHIQTKLHLKGTGLFKYMWHLNGHYALKGKDLFQMIVPHIKKENSLYWKVL